MDILAWVGVGMILLLFVIQVLIFISRYKKVGVGQVLVITGRVSQDPNQQAIIKRSGSVFIVPIIQDYEYVDISASVVTIRFESLEYRIKGDIRIGFVPLDSDEGILKYMRISRDDFALRDEIIEGISLSSLYAILDGLPEDKRRDSLLLKRELESKMTDLVGDYGIQLITVKVAVEKVIS